MTVTVHRNNLLTENQRLHHMVKAQRVKVLRHTASLLVRSQAIPPMQRAHLTVWVSWPTRHRRDVSNLLPTAKALVDGAVSGPAGRKKGDPAWPWGILPDDDDRHLIGPDLRVTDELSGLPGVVRLRMEWEEL